MNRKTAKKTARPKSGRRVKSTTTTRRARTNAHPARELWLAGLGAAAASGEKASELVELLVAKGRETEPAVVATAGRVLESARERATRTAADLGSEAKVALEKALDKLGVPQRPRNKNLLHRLGDLAEAIL